MGKEIVREGGVWGFVILFLAPGVIVLRFGICDLLSSKNKEWGEFF